MFCVVGIKGLVDGGVKLDYPAGSNLVTGVLKREEPFLVGQREVIGQSFHGKLLVVKMEEGGREGGGLWKLSLTLGLQSARKRGPQSPNCRELSSASNLNELRTRLQIRTQPRQSQFSPCGVSNRHSTCRTVR